MGVEQLMCFRSLTKISYFVSLNCVTMIAAGYFWQTGYSYITCGIKP